MTTTAALAWTAALALIAIQWAPLPGSSLVVTVALRVPAVREFLPARALTLLELADFVALALRAARFFRAVAA